MNKQSEEVGVVSDSKGRGREEGGWRRGHELRFVGRSGAIWRCLQDHLTDFQDVAYVKFGDSSLLQIRSGERSSEREKRK